MLPRKACGLPSILAMESKPTKPVSRLCSQKTFRMNQWTSMSAMNQIQRRNHLVLLKVIQISILNKKKRMIDFKSLVKNLNY